MSWIWRRSLAARFICVTLLALALSQLVAFQISWGEHGQAMRKSAKGELLSRAASLVRVLEATPSDLHQDILAASNTSMTRYWISAGAPGSALDWRDEAWTNLSQPLPRLFLAGYPGGAAEEAAAPRDRTLSGTAAWFDVPASSWPLARPAKFTYLNDTTGMGMAIPLANGSWLNSAFSRPVQDSFWNRQTLTALAISAVVLSLLAILAARGIATPLRRLARAAEALGRGQQTAALPETGPDDIRRTTEAFNRMQERLTRFVEDRTRMLAAIGHDLRTPLTSLRLRAEFVADEELREKILSTVIEIQSMCEATLTFVREEAMVEETRAVDLAALVGSLCEDLAELGQAVICVEAPRIHYRCRPAALRRACRNLIENAVRYGDRARVSIQCEAASIDIIVEDDGPGIPPEALEQVFAPFFRLEHSRNRETGGVGLGLPIARSILRHHGGDVMLLRQARGLRAVMRLPALDSASIRPAPRAGSIGKPAPAARQTASWA